MSGKGDSGSLLATKLFPDGTGYDEVAGQLFSGAIGLSDTPTETFALANWDNTVLTLAEEILTFLSAITGEEFDFVSRIS